MLVPCSRLECEPYINRFSKDLDHVDSLLPDSYLNLLQNAFYLVSVIILCMMTTWIAVPLFVPIFGKRADVVTLAACYVFLTHPHALQIGSRFHCHPKVFSKILSRNQAPRGSYPLARLLAVLRGAPGRHDNSCLRSQIALREFASRDCRFQWSLFPGILVACPLGGATARLHSYACRAFGFGMFTLYGGR